MPTEYWRVETYTSCRSTPEGGGKQIEPAALSKPAITLASMIAGNRYAQSPEEESSRTFGLDCAS